MKIQLKYLTFGIFVFSTFCLQPSTSCAQGTAFTYNGSLAVGGKSANGNYDMRFSLFTTATGGAASAGPITNPAVTVSNGLFMTTIDFGPGVFTGASYWMAISVSPTGSNTFTDLAPRQIITPVPYAVFSENAGSAATANSVSAANIMGTLQLTQLPASVAQLPGTVLTNNQTGVTLSGTFMGDGSGLTNLSGGNLMAGSVGAVQLAEGTLAAPVEVASNINAAADTRYAVTNAGDTTLFLPANANSGDVIQITGDGPGGWTALDYSANWIPTTAPNEYWYSMASSADGTHLVAAANYINPFDPDDPFSAIYTSSNSGVSWTPTQTYFEAWISMASSADGMRLIAAADNDGIYGNIELSTNAGATWIAPSSLNDDPGWNSVASSADGTHLVALPESGGVFVSTNSGMSWTEQASAPGGGTWGSMALSSDGAFLVASAYPGGIYSSTNLGATWTPTSAPNLGFNSLASSSNGTYLAAVSFGGGVYTSTNFGTNWTEQTSIPTTAEWTSVASSSDGTHLAAAGYSGGGIYVSTNFGINWTEQTSAPSSNWSQIVSSSGGTPLYAINLTGKIYVSGGYEVVASGGQDTTTSFQYLGNGQWSSANLSQMSFSGTFIGNGSDLTNISAATLISSGNTNGGSGNFFIGPSGNSTTSGGENTANGFRALYSNTSGSENTADGYYALLLNAVGTGNTANGASALSENVSGNNNTADGAQALGSLGVDDLPDGGTNNIALGYQAGLNFIGNESSNIDIGNPGVAGENNIIRIGSDQTQTFIAGVINGNGSGLTNLNTAQLISIGNTNGGSGNFFVGPSGNSTTSGAGNTAGGVAALSENTTGSYNTANGVGALGSNTTANFNTANGALALADNANGQFNTASGADALNDNTSGSANTANGCEALIANQTGADNTANGAFALLANTIGNGNTADGVNALYSNTNGVDNIALGYQAGYNITDGNNNIEIGNAGRSNDNDTIDIGTQGTQTNTSIAGIYGATVASGVPVYVTASGQLGTLTSSARFKKDIRSMNSASDVLLSLRPVTFKYKSGIDPKGILQFGLIAEEVDKVDPDLVAHDDQGKPYTVRYEAVNAMLLNEFLKQHAEVEEQNAEIEQLQQSVAELKRLVQTLGDKKR